MEKLRVTIGDVAIVLAYGREVPTGEAVEHRRSDAPGSVHIPRAFARAIGVTTRVMNGTIVEVVRTSP